jgi:alkanesulfonate monooxygenase SsuD/methylene tetrahydromethanopterin reductase-like flavin-dependent oxidoreductase (luciferase family)
LKKGVVVLPVLPWPAAERAWREVEDLGFDSAWTYDHVQWGGWIGKPWQRAFPLLGAVAAVTSRVRLGTLVSSINLRHPVALAQAVRTVDDISGGRFDLGIGAGTRGFDASVHGGEEWSASERVTRFAEYVELVHELLTTERTTFDGAYYTAVDAPMYGARRVPFTVAADKPRAMSVAARFGDRWVANTVYGDVEAKCRRLDDACTAIGRDPASIARVLLVDEFSFELSAAALEREVDGAVALGFAEVVVRHPLDGDRSTLEAFARMG